MKNKKFLIVLILVFVVLFAGAYVLYERLGASVEAEQIVVHSTPQPAEANADEAEEAEWSKDYYSFSKRIEII